MARGSCGTQPDNVFGPPPLSQHATVPFGFRRQVSWVTQEHSSTFLLAAPRIRQRASRRTRSMRLSPHCAFQLGPGTHGEQTHGCPWGGAPVGQPYRHLLSSLHLFASLFTDLPWRTFTLSAPLQPGVWLRRRLGPLSRVLVFSHPLRVLRLQSSLLPLPDVIAPHSCLLYAGWSYETVLTRIQSRGGYHLPVLGMASQPVSPFYSYDASNTGFFRQHRAQGSRRFPWTGSEIQLFVNGLHTAGSAAPRRMPFNPLVTVQTRLL